MPSCLYITDPSWIANLQASGVADGVNFWRKDKRSLGLLPGDQFYFKLKGRMQIAGRATFREQIQLTIDEAWREFGLGNGVTSATDLALRAKDVLGTDDDEINCLILDNVDILDQGMRPEISATDFPTSIMNCKFFAVGTLPVIENSFSSSASLSDWLDQQGAPSFDPGYISSERARTLRSICARRGQARFRQNLITAYNGACCVTGETTLAVLEAAHIHPYRGEDTDQPSNGLLLRSDLHTLFDLGLWTVDAAYIVRIAPTLNTSVYAAFAGRRIAVPAGASVKPSHAALKYHRETIFQG